MTAQDERVPDAAWDEPAGVNPRGTLIVIPGRGEEPSLYERFGRRLSADGYRVRVLRDPVADAATTLAQAAGQLTSPGTVAPKVLVGSDTGALYAITLAATGEAGQADGLILAGLPTPGQPAAAGSGSADAEQAWQGELESRTNCPTHRDVLSRSAARRGALFNPAPEGWLDQADLGQVKVPIIGFHGAADPVSPLAGARDSYRRAPAAQLLSITDGKHDALNDATHRTVAATIVLFLERLRLGDDLPAIATTEQLEPAGP